MKRLQIVNRFMQRAIKLSLENVRSGAGGPFAALVVRGDEIIAEGVNQVTQTNDPTAHAEVVAIRTASRPNRDNLRVSGRIVRLGHLIDTFGDDFIAANYQRCEWASGPRTNIFQRELNRSLHEAIHYLKPFHD